MENRLCLVGCGSTKKKSKSYSWDIYESDYFHKRMTVAMLMGQPAILSAKHGLLLANERINPYDEDMRQKSEKEKKEWALEVFQSVPDRYTEVVILAGKEYRYPLIDMLKKEVKVFSPFDDDEISGIGHQISWCKTTAEKILSGQDIYSIL